MVTKSLCIAAMTFAMATTAHAAALRTFGSDGNTSTNCSHAQPCRTFAAAVTVTSSGGEIEALDPAGYGPITITGPLSLIGLPGAAVNAPSGGAGITISAPPTAVVSISGLIVDGGGVATVGILFQNGASLIVENCIVQNMSSAGDGIGLNFDTAAKATLVVSNSHFNNSTSGIYIQTRGSNAITASIERSTFSGNSDSGLEPFGALGTGAINVAVTDSVVANNSVGIGPASSTGHSPTHIILTRTTISGNDQGIVVLEANTAVWLSQTTITGNAIFGYRTSLPGVINTLQNNVIVDNGSNSGSLTNAPPF